MSAMHPLIAIIGAGLGGLALGLCLKHKGVAAVVYERAASAPRYNYGITLHASTYRPLLGMLRMDERTFRERLAVDAYVGGAGKLADTKNASSQGDSFRCHRGRLESLLRQDLSVVWNKKLVDIQTTGASSQVTALFEDGSSLTTGFLIGCDGPHSATRQIVDPEASALDILPYVVFNGKRRVPYAEYMQTWHRYLQSSTLLTQTIPIDQHTIPTDQVQDTDRDQDQTNGKRKGNIRLEVSLCDITPSHADLSWTYSRPAITNTNTKTSTNPSPNANTSPQTNTTTTTTTTTTDNNNPDPLHNPLRALHAATQIPAEFYTELSAVHKQHLLTPTPSPPPFPSSASASASASTSPAVPLFATLFNPASIHERKDRVLHWLMRSAPLPPTFSLSHTPPTNKSTPPTLESKDATSSQPHSPRITLIGDARHATPILGSEGANLAVEDALALAGWISEQEEGGQEERREGTGEDGAGKRIRGIGSWESSRRSAVWEEAVREGRERVVGLHFGGEGDSAEGEEEGEGREREDGSSSKDLGKETRKDKVRL